MGHPEELHDVIVVALLEKCGGFFASLRMTKI